MFKRTHRYSIFAVVLLWLNSGYLPAAAFSDATLIDGFNRTVFGSEISSFKFLGRYVRKFKGPVRFFIRSEVGGDAKSRTEQFVRSLNGMSPELITETVEDESSANFIVHVVRRSNFKQTVRQSVLRREDAKVVGKCLVRSIYSRAGIARSDAVIVADEGDNLFRRCMVEELVQGLGLLNDDPSLSLSMFNDSSRYTRFQPFDKALLTMLYDRRIRNGASKSSVERVLSAVARDAQRAVFR